MAPSVSVLQLDTQFPRVPGDVGYPQTYRGAVEIIRIPGATVGTIVSNRPDKIDIAPFEQAVAQAAGDIIVTSCGFLSYWQAHLAACTQKPFVSSSLIALDALSLTYSPDALMIVTFDADSLTQLHLGRHANYAASIVGLPREMHLRKVISENQSTLGTDLVAAELTDFIATAQRPQHQHILFECTNLPPYKTLVKSATGLAITDILTCIETLKPGTIHHRFLDSSIAK